MRGPDGPRSFPSSVSQSTTTGDLAGSPTPEYYDLLRLRKSPAETGLPIESKKARLKSKEKMMPQKIIEVVGVSKESFAKAAENAVAEAAKTVRGLKWARVAELEMELEGKKITQYRATTKIYFDIEH
jgi:dodecin